MNVQTLTIGKQRVVVLPESEYKRLLSDAERVKRDALDFANEAIGHDLRSKRDKVKMSQEQVAMKAGIRVETLSRIESGKANPTVSTVKKILKALGEKV